MIIGALRLTFMVPPDGKSTHSAAQKIKDRLWSKFKLALSGTAHGKRATTCYWRGYRGVMRKDKTRARLEQVVIKHLNEWGSVELVNDEIELVHFDDLEL